jgi:hypothetical protein
MEFLIVLGSGAFALGLALVIWIALVRRRGQGSPNWPSTVGMVSTANVAPMERETPRGVERTFTPVVTYTYTVAGQPYESRQRNLLPDESATYQDPAMAWHAIAKYPVGAAVKVYHNPINPKQAVLEIPKAVAHHAVLLYGVTSMVVGAAIIVLGVLLLP